MNGAFCLACGPEGPDLCFDAAPLGVNCTIVLQFTCGRCGAVCRWAISKTAEGLEYRPVTQVPIRDFLFAHRN